MRYTIYCEDVPLFMVGDKRGEVEHIWKAFRHAFRVAPPIGLEPEYLWGSEFRNERFVSYEKTCDVVDLLRFIESVIPSRCERATKWNDLVSAARVFYPSFGDAKTMNFVYNVIDDITPFGVFEKWSYIQFQMKLDIKRLDSARFTVDDDMVVHSTDKTDKEADRFIESHCLNHPFAIADRKHALAHWLNSRVTDAYMEMEHPLLMEHIRRKYK